MINIVDCAAKISRQHTRYYIEKAGRKLQVPGTTTIIDVMEKPGLKIWANELGLQGIKLNQYVDVLAQAGTLGHYLGIQEMLGYNINTPEVREILSQYSADIIDLATNSALKFLDWVKTTGFEPIFTEKQLLSTKHEYGGTIDLYGKLTKRNNKLVLADLKTGKGIYDNMFTQVAGGYGILMTENNYPYDDVIIVRIGRNANEGNTAEEKSCLCCKLHEELFLFCRKIYDLNAKIRKIK
jgi:hypothetical protein